MRDQTRTRRLAGFTHLAVLAALCLWTAGASALPGEATIESFKEARSLLEDDPGRAYEIAIALDRLEHADDARLHLIAEAALKSQRVEEALKWLKEFEEATPSANERFEARLERAELLAVLGRVEDADSLAKKLRREQRRIRVRSADRRFLRSRLLRLRHDLALASEDESAARGLAEDLLIYYPSEVGTLRAGLAKTVDDLSTRERYRRAQQLVDSWGYKAARVEYELLIDIDEYEEEARWNLGEIGLRKLRDRPKEAEAFFKELANSNSKYAEKALYYVARAQMKQEQYDEARKTFETYKKRYPRGNYALLADYYGGWLHYDHRENEKALVGLKAFIDKRGIWASKITYVTGFYSWALMRLERWEEAIDAWEDMFRYGNPLVEGKARYWRAVALHKLGRDDEAIEGLDTLRERWPITYYGMLGEQLRAKIQGKDPRASKVWWPKGGGNLDDSPRLDVVNYDYGGLPKSLSEDWQRVLSLALIGEKHRARDELDGIYKSLKRRVKSDDEHAWIHAVGRLVGDYNPMYAEIAGRQGISGRPGMIESDTLEAAMYYPRAYREIVDQVAEEFGLYPGFIWSIMRQESRYKPGAISYTDAIGALQMIPKTARKVARDMGTVYNVATFFRPEVGFRFSGFYMRKLLDVFDGLWVPAAAAYNSGPEVVARWFKKNPEAEFAWLIEEFEYNEGRAYCRKIAEHMLRYLYLYESDEKVRAEILDDMFPLSRDITIPEDVGY